MADMVAARKEGLYCVPGDFYIDPWRPVERAIITHAHSDHARGYIVVVISIRHID